MTKPLAVFPILFALLLLGAAPVTHAACFATGETNVSRLCWNPLHPLPAAFELESVTWSAARGEFIAVGAGGAIATRADGEEWRTHRTGFVHRLYDALWDGQRYIIVGEGGLILTGTPEDGWESRITNTRLALFAIAWNGLTANPVYLAVGQNGALLRSVNAVEWQASSIGIGENGNVTLAPDALGTLQRPAPTLFGIAWGLAGFVAVGSSGTVIGSEDGTAWELHLQDTVDRIPLFDVAVNGNGSTFAAVGDRGLFVLSGPDGQWGEPQHSDAFPGAGLRGVAWDPAGGGFIVAGREDSRNPDSAALVLHLPLDGLLTTANDIEAPPIASLQAVAANNVMSVAAGHGAILDRVAGDEWAQVAPERPPHDLNAVVRVQGIGDAGFYLVAGDTGTLLRSDDGGRTWRAPQGVDTDSSLHGLAAAAPGGARRMVAVGEDGLILHATSTDGENWAEASVPAGTPDLSGATFGSTRFVAVGAQTILVADDETGEAWTAVDQGNLPGGIGGLRDVVWRADTGRHVAVGSAGTVIWSAADAAGEWQRAVLPEGLEDAVLNAVFANNERYVAVGATGSGAEAEALVLVSPAGDAWERATIAGAEAIPGLLAVEWNGAQFIATFASSGDPNDVAFRPGGFLRGDRGGEAWSVLGTGSPRDDVRMNALVADGPRFIAVGAGGRILDSGEADVVLAVLGSGDADDLPQFARAGRFKSLRFNVVNIGNLDVNGVQFTYELPADAEFEAPAIVPDGDLSCSIFADGSGAQCFIGDMVAGGAEPGVTIAVNIIPDDVEEIVNAAEVAVGPVDGDPVDNNPVDINPANNRITFLTSVGPREGPTLPSPDVEFVGGGALGWAWLLPLLGWAAWGRRRIPRT